MRDKNSIQIRPLSRSEVRAIEQQAIDQIGMTGLMLMENEGRNAAETIDAIAPPGEVCVLCGKGNNGGDGYVIARHLETMGRRVRIVALASPADLKGDAAVNQRIAALADIPIAMFDNAAGLGAPASIVDCLLGTGASGSPREPLASAIRCANDAAAFRIAIDVPSGMDCDTGVPADPTFRAAHTLTFVASKLGFAAPQDVEAYAERLTAMVARLADEFAPQGEGRRYRLLIGGHPAIKGKTTGPVN